MAPDADEYGEGGGLCRCLESLMCVENVAEDVLSPVNIGHKFG